MTLVRWVGDADGVDESRLAEGERLAKAGFDFYAVPAGCTLIPCDAPAHAFDAAATVCRACEGGAWGWKLEAVECRRRPTPCETLVALVDVFRASDLAEVECNGKTPDPVFESAEDAIADEVCDVVDQYSRHLGHRLARQQAMLALLNEVHEDGGVEAALAVLKELVEALDQWPESVKLRLVGGVGR